VLVHTDLTLSGAVAQYGRAQGVIADVSQVMIDTFAENLKRRIESKRPQGADHDDATRSAEPPQAAAPAPAMSVFSILAAVVRRWFCRFKEKHSQ